jgi:hypothetical protein
VSAAARPALTYARLLDLHHQRTLADAAPAPPTEAERAIITAALTAEWKG